MTRIIYCVFLKKNAIGLESLCYPGPLGERIYNNISQKAWMQWQDKQTILINEKKLNMMHITDRAFLEKEMEYFLFGKNKK